MNMKVFDFHSCQRCLLVVKLKGFNILNHLSLKLATDQQGHITHDPIAHCRLSQSTSTCRNLTEPVLPVRPSPFKLIAAIYKHQLCGLNTPDTINNSLEDLRTHATSQVQSLHQCSCTLVSVLPSLRAFSKQIPLIFK